MRLTRCSGSRSASAVRTPSSCARAASAGSGARRRTPENHGEVLDARERERARDVRGGEPLHVGAIAAEMPEAREHDELRHEAALADRQHEHFAGGRTDRAPPREVADRAVQHPVDVLGSAGRLDVREGAEDDRGGIALGDAAFHERELDRLRRRVPLRRSGGSRRQGDADELVQELALLALGEVAPGDLSARAPRAGLPARASARRDGAAALAAARCVVAGCGRDPRPRGRRPRCPAASRGFPRVPGRKARPLREGKRHGAVARGTAAESTACGPSGEGRARCPGRSPRSGGSDRPAAAAA